jgi:hypothetical protein
MRGRIFLSKVSHFFGRINLAMLASDYRCELHLLNSNASKQDTRQQHHIGDREHVENICRGDNWDSQA